MENFRPLIESLSAAIEHAKTIGRIEWTDKAREKWHAIYPELSEGKPGLVGSLIARAEAQAVRLCVIYALLDGSDKIEVVHLEAALAIMDYVEASVKYIFQDSIGDSLANEILEALSNKPDGMTRTEIYKYFNYHKSSGQIESSLKLLSANGKIKMEIVETGGRPKEIWILNRI
jgi:hypothetical protein